MGKGMMQILFSSPAVDSAKVFERDLTGITVDDGFMYDHWPPKMTQLFRWMNYDRIQLDYWPVDGIVGDIRLYPNVCSWNPSRRSEISPHSCELNPHLGELFVSRQTWYWSATFFFIGSSPNVGHWRYWSSALNTCCLSNSTKLAKIVESAP